MWPWFSSSFFYTTLIHKCLVIFSMCPDKNKKVDEIRKTLKTNAAFCIELHRIPLNLNDVLRSSSTLTESASTHTCFQIGNTGNTKLFLIKFLIKIRIYPQIKNERQKKQNVATIRHQWYMSFHIFNNCDNATITLFTDHYLIFINSTEDGWAKAAHRRHSWILH